MTLREIINQLIQIALFFAFPAIWSWILRVWPGFPLDPQSTLNILIFLGVTVVSWVLGLFGIRRFIATIKTKGLAADVVGA